MLPAAQTQSTPTTERKRSSRGPWDVDPIGRIVIFCPMTTLATLKTETLQWDRMCAQNVPNQPICSVEPAGYGLVTTVLTTSYGRSPHSSGG